MNAPIGIIDSGVGGLTVVKEMLERLPHEPIIYIGDDERCPYGPRPEEEVRQFTTEMATALADMGIKMLVIACNTATAAAMDDIREQFNFPVIGVIEPGARAAVNASKMKKIAVLGTLGTINSCAYNDAIHAFSVDAQIHSLACPEFVPIVEKGHYKTEKAGHIVERTLHEISNKDFDAVILGCTHYPLLQHHIQNHLPKDVTIISSAIETVCDVERTLRLNSIANKPGNDAPSVFYTTGELHDFQEIVIDWLSIEKPDVRTIIL
ncbi:glutamate racemase [Filibacter tadaridae]|uniref:Glutamate racemase n=1 Tax=Filibacter tadaridae TaxID=2483811 RepID=A0A3P5XCV3_9BACL|nr:glutamate racemase [Filibacter tadaridae]VDC32681.1 Glutamate racemase [Filibacter tadaridae]